MHRKVGVYKDDLGYTNFGVSVKHAFLIVGEILPTRLPDELEALILVPKMDYGLPDYQQYFENALVLQDDVLVPFLALFRKHLEEVQVGLGKVDEWQSEAQEIKDFLEGVLKVEVSVGVEQVVKKFKSSDEYGVLFDVSTEAGRTKLEKFVDFLECYMCDI